MMLEGSIMDIKPLTICRNCKHCKDIDIDYMIVCDKHHIGKAKCYCRDFERKEDC